MLNGGEHEEGDLVLAVKEYGDIYTGTIMDQMLQSNKYIQTSILQNSYQ